MAKLSESDRKRLVKELMAGTKSVRELAKKYGISSSMVQKYKGEIDDESARLIDTGVMYKKGLAAIKDPQKVNAIVNAVDERTKHLEFFQNSALENQELSNKALKAIRSSIEKETDEQKKTAKALVMLPALETHGKITERNKNIVVGKDPEIKVDNNVRVNTQQITQVQTAEEASRLYLDIIQGRA